MVAEQACKTAFRELIVEKKKVLIITYYWPPAGGPGVQRWLKFAKYLPDFNWEPIIYTPANPSYPLLDESLVNEVPESIKTLKTNIWEPYHLAEKFGKDNRKFKAGQFDVGKNQTWKSKLSIWVRGNFFIPDARVFWVKPSVKFLKKYLAENPVDVLVTTGPPHSLHLIGLNLKKELRGLKWVADFRDPWTEISYYKHLKLSKYADKKHRALEQKVFENADLTLATSYTDAENFALKGAKSLCITNGFDGMPSHTKPKNKKFTLSYIGVLEQLRNPRQLWYVIYELLNENPEFAADFSLKFVGKIDPEIKHEFVKIGIDHVVSDLGYLSHAVANTEMRNSDLLLITNFPQESSRGIIPGKIFEYLSTGNKILSFGPDKSDVQKILMETGAGVHFNYEAEALKTFLLETYSTWKAGTLQNNASPSIEKFSRKNLTEKLSEALNTFL